MREVDYKTWKEQMQRIIRSQYLKVSLLSNMIQKNIENEFYATWAKNSIAEVLKNIYENELLVKLATILKDESLFFIDEEGTPVLIPVTKRLKEEYETLKNSMYI